MFEVVAYTDASNRIDQKPGEPGPALGLLIPNQQGVIARALSFPLPLPFLHGKDERGNNHGNTILTEGLAVLSALIRYPNTFQGKTVLFYTDSTGLVQNYKKCKAKGFYNAHLIRCLYLVKERLHCNLTITWQRRRSTAGTRAADTLTHQDFSEVPPHVNYQKIEELPKPILVTLNQSIVYKTNSFNKLWPRILKYWEN